SCIGVEDLVHALHVDYSGRAGSPAVLVLSLESGNGAVYRLVTPEFNDYEKCEKGFRLCAPDGTSMRVQLLSAATSNPPVTTSRYRYGGNTITRNPGVQYRGTSYESVTAIDIACGPCLTMVMTLAPPAGSHPDASVDGQRVTVGGNHYWIH
ncbi:MAG: hypothetical protein ACOC4I_01340, partial [Spirochaetota bacterium]